MPPYILRCVHSKNRNCFLGVNPKTFNNNVRNALDFKVSTVRLNLGSEQYLYFSTFPDYTLTDGQFSLNGFFALKISIQQDRFYEIEELNDTVQCRNVTFCPVSIDDWDVLQNNTEMTEEVFLNQIRVLSLNMIFPIWISGLCILLRVVEIEPNDYSVISSSTRVIVIPEYRPQQQSTTMSSSPPPSIDNLSIEHSGNSLKTFVRSIGSYVSSSFPDGSKVVSNKKLVKPNLTLIPGRHRRLFRVELDDNNTLNPTIARINRVDWSSDADDSTNWPDIFVAKITVYRSNKLDSIPEQIPHIYFLLVQLINSNTCRKNHVKLSSSFASMNCIRPTDKLIICNTTRRARQQTRIEFVAQRWSSPILLLQHYFHVYLREQFHNNDQPILLTDGCFLRLNELFYRIRLICEDEPGSSDSPIYIAMNEDTLGQHTIAFDEQSEWKWNEIEGFRSMSIVEPFSSQKDQTSTTDRLVQILELQFQNDYLLKNVIVTGRNGCGKKTIVNEACQRLWTKDLVFFKHIDCLSFKGRKLDIIVSSFQQLLDEMIFRQPSILILDHFDDLFPNETTITDANIILATQKLSLSIRELFARIQKIHKQLIIIPIAKQITNIHRLFTEETPLFTSQIFAIESLNSTQRTSIIKQLIESKNQTISDSLLQSIVNRTESFVMKDLYTLIDNALLHSWMSFERDDTQQLQTIDFDYAFDEYQPISVKLLDDSKKSNRTNLSWTDIGGIDEIKQELIQTVQWRFEHSKYFSNAPIRLVSGVLLYGPSGCGKTLVAQTLANECKVNFLQVKGPELLNKYVGSSEQNIRDLFNRARSVTPCIILFDEFEALVPRRGRDSAGVTDRVVNQLLTELDGVESLGDIVVIAATSRPDLIDPALLRPGRLDKHLYIGFPTKTDLTSILKIWTRKIRLADDVQLDDDEFLSHCEMYTGADIKALIYNAQLAAYDEYQTRQEIIINRKHFEIAFKQTPCSIAEHLRNANEHFYRNWRKPINIDNQTTSLA